MKILNVGDERRTRVTCPAGQYPAYHPDLTDLDKMSRSFISLDAPTDLIRVEVFARRVAYNDPHWHVIGYEVAPPLPVPVEIVVAEPPLTWWQRLRLWLGFPTARALR